MTRVARVACSIGVAVALASSMGAAQVPTDNKAAAEELFERAKKLAADKDFTNACPTFAESLRIDPGLGVMLHLASCYERAGKPASAWAQFREAEQIATKDHDKRAEVARKRAEALEPKLFRLTVVVAKETDVDGLVIRRDGIFIDRPQWGAPVPIDPGEHLLIATAPNKKRVELTVTVPPEQGETSITIPQLADAPAAAPPPVVPPHVDPPSVMVDPGRKRRLAAIAVAGAGVVALGVGGYFGLHASSLNGDSNEGGHCRADNHCDATGAGLRNDAQAAGNTSTILFGVGLAAVAGAAVLYFTAPKPHAQPSTGAASTTFVVRPGGVELRGAF